MTVDPINRGFKCFCPPFRRGKYCQIKLMSSSMLILNDTIGMVSNSSNPKNNSIQTLTSSTIFTPVSRKQHSSGLFNINTLVKANHTAPPLFKFKPESSTHANRTTKLTFIPISDKFKQPCNYDTCQLGKCLDNDTCQCVLVSNIKN